MLKSRYLSINRNIISSIPIPITLNTKSYQQKELNQIELNFSRIKELSQNINKILLLLCKKFIFSNIINSKAKKNLIKKIKNFHKNSINLKDKALIQLNESQKKELIDYFKQIKKKFEEINKEIYRLFNIPQDLIEEIETFFFKQN